MAIRSSLASARLAHLMTMRDQRPEDMERTIELLQNPHLRVMLRLLVVTLHFLLAGVTYLLWHSLRPDLDTLPLALIVLFVAVIILLALEFSVEGRLIVKDEEWAIRFIPLGRIMNFFFTPLSSLLCFLGSASDLASYHPDYSR